MGIVQSWKIKSDQGHDVEQLKKFWKEYNKSFKFKENVCWRMIENKYESFFSEGIVIKFSDVEPKKNLGSSFSEVKS